jgi:hypothetical protein
VAKILTLIASYLTRFQASLCPCEKRGSNTVIIPPSASDTTVPEILVVSGEKDQFDANKPELVRNFQYTTAFIDSTGTGLLIALAIPNVAEGLERLVEECNRVQKGTAGSLRPGGSLTSVPQPQLFFDGRPSSVAGWLPSLCTAAKRRMKFSM